MILVTPRPTNNVSKQHKLNLMYIFKQMVLNRNYLYLSVLIIFIGISIFFLLQNIMLYHVYSLANSNNCPFCYGQSMCDCISNNFSFNWNYFWTNLISSYFGKHVFFGICDGKSVVIKHFPMPKIYVNVSKIKDIQSIAEVAQLINLKSHLDEMKHFEICSSLDKIVNLCIQFKEYPNGKTRKLDDSTIHKNVLHMIQVNIAPIVQQIAYANEWAVPEYLGSCGDIVVSKYCGESLTDVFQKLNWTQRSSIAKQLLEFAYNATFKHPDFAFYFTDMTPDNFAVSVDNIVRLVDIENVVIVDRHPSDQPATWTEYHKSYHDPLEQGFTFSLREVCSHETSDLNVYSICQDILTEKSNLLKGGLLHSPPIQDERISKLVQECVSPTSDKSRFETAQAILQHLDLNKPQYN